jgi:spore maturation protein CgeB
MFYHSLLADWNNGNAHFLRGVVTELLARGHQVIVYEPRDAWSLRNLLSEHGDAPMQEFRAVYNGLTSIGYDLSTLDLNRALDGADVVIVHEWNDYGLVQRIGAHRALRTGYRLLFHDTHHRSVTEPESIAACNLKHYDGVLAFGNVIRDRYLAKGWVERAWTWHEAADTRVFYPHRHRTHAGDLVWIGNWGDEERTRELKEFLMEPVKRLCLKAQAYGVRYPEAGLKALADAGIDYSGWLPNYKVPHVFACFKATVHIPRRPYVEALPGIPTIRPFEALACGIPLVCSPWDDAEGLFTPGRDFLVANNAEEMIRHLQALMYDEAIAQELSAHGRRTVLQRHTCAHRVDELLKICEGLGANVLSDTTESGSATGY